MKHIHIFTVLLLASSAASHAATVSEIATAMEFLNAPVEPAPADQLNLWEQLSHALLASNELIILP